MLLLYTSIEHWLRSMQALLWCNRVISLVTVQSALSEDGQGGEECTLEQSTPYVLLVDSILVCV